MIIVGSYFIILEVNFVEIILRDRGGWILPLMVSVLGLTDFSFII
jgi:hypothetical protein